MFKIVNEFRIVPDSKPFFSTQIWRYLRLRLLSIDAQEATFAKRRFWAGDIKIQQRLEEIGSTFLYGYHLAIDNPQALVPQLNLVDSDLRGFAFEGAGMGLSLLDYLTLGKRHYLETFCTGGGADHIYLVYVGMGWFLARIPGGIQRYLTRLQQQANIRKAHQASSVHSLKSPDPLLGWLAVDGYGFHQGYFHHQRYVESRIIPPGISDYALRVFDQGLGRSLWFIYGADVTRISVAIASFDPNRRADLWSGVGLASGYAGGVHQTDLEALKISAGAYLPHLAQGVAFAAKARQRADNLSTHTETACEVLCEMSAPSAAEVTDLALEDLPTDAVLPVYELWRQRIQNKFTNL